MRGRSGGSCDDWGGSMGKGGETLETLVNFVQGILEAMLALSLPIHNICELLVNRSQSLFQSGRGTWHWRSMLRHLRNSGNGKVGEEGCRGHERWR